jgi:hypothetical protein
MGAMMRKKLLMLLGDDTLVAELQERGLDMGQDAEARIERNYETLDSLGKGASGVVYRVRPPQTQSCLTLCLTSVWPFYPPLLRNILDAESSQFLKFLFIRF